MAQHRGGGGGGKRVLRKNRKKAGCKSKYESVGETEWEEEQNFKKRSRRGEEIMRGEETSENSAG